MTRYVDEEDLKPPVLRRIAVKNLLSFGPDGIDLEFRPLNVLVGPNGSGKSNLYEVLGLLGSTTSDRVDYVRQNGGIREWLWRGRSDVNAVIEAEIRDPVQQIDVRHRLEIGDSSGDLRIVSEEFEIFEQENLTNNALHDAGDRMVLQAARPERAECEADGSVCRSALVNTQDNYVDPTIEYIGRLYDGIQIYAGLGGDALAELRRPESINVDNGNLRPDGSNLASSLHRIAQSDAVRDELVEGIRNLSDGLENVELKFDDGIASLGLMEGDYVATGARISDGSLRYLCLLAVLLDPDPRPVVAIEHPERGIHPDLMPYLTDLFRDATTRTQLLVTTHNDTIVDAMHDHYESVVVTEKYRGQTEFRRLSQSDMAPWVEKHRLGDLWTSGQLGGVRW